MVRKLGWFVVVAGFIALVIYGGTAESGPMGWLNASQQALFGSYSRKFSFLIVFFGAFAVASPLLLWLFFADAKARVGPEAAKDFGKVAVEMMAPTPRTLPSLRFWFGAWVVVTALIWAGCAGWALWQAQQRRGDADASYLPFKVAQGARAPAGADHLALQGRLLWDRVVAKQPSHASTPELELVPIVGDDWREGDAVQFVARIERGDLTITRARPRRGEEPLLVRVSGDLPTPAIPVFKQLGAPLANDAVAVKVVPSIGQAPSDAAGVDWSDVRLSGLIGSIIWAVAVAAIVLSTLVNGRTGSRQALSRRDA